MPTTRMAGNAYDVAMENLDTTAGEMGPENDIR